MYKEEHLDQLFKIAVIGAIFVVFAIGFVLGAVIF